MKVQVKKRNIIIIAIILLAIVVGIIATMFVVPNMKISETHKKLKQINAKELETKILAKLENSTLNLNTTSVETTFIVNTDKPIGTDILSEYVAEKYQFITINIADTTSGATNFMKVDLCKIESDSSGKLKSIEYIDGGTNGGECNFIIEIVQDIIKNVLKTEYDIDTNVIEDLRYKENSKIKYSFNQHKKDVFINGNDWCATILETISNNSNKHFNKSNYYNDIDYVRGFYFDTTKITI